MDDTNRLDLARDAAARRAWDEAYDLFTQADALEPLDAADLALLADAAYSSGHLDTTIESWERAHALALETGDTVGAAGAAIRVALHVLMDTGMMAPVRGWITRAERLLEGTDTTPLHAWIAVVRMYERLLSGDFATSRDWSNRAVAIGTEHGEAGAVALGHVAQARALVYEGDVQEGLALLDEAAVTCVSGELDPLTTGMIYCELLCTCQGLAQYDRAEEWTDAYERWRRTDDVGSMGARCRVHRAELLRLRGDCSGAEAEALRACEELRPYLRIEYGWPLTELGRIRLRRGDLDGAEEAFLGAHEAGWDPQPGLALLRLTQGDVGTADRLIRDALEHPMNVPSKELPPNTELRRAPLLDAQVEIAIAAGDVERARWASGELGGIAGAFGSKAIEAMAAQARGRVALAGGEAAAARDDFDVACRLWTEVSAPYEAAVARTGLADAHRAEGNAERARMELHAAHAAFERIGARLEADRASEAPASREPVRGPSANTFCREGDSWSIVYEGNTFRLRDLRGLRYLSRMLADPGREFHVVDLTSEGSGAASPTPSDDGLSAPGDAGVLLDARAKEQYKRRLLDIDDDLEEARAFGDDGRIARAGAERELLIRELSRAVGLSGRDRRAGVASERARASVTQAVRHAMARIREHDAALGEHLDRAVRTGTYCVYLPDPRAPVDWKL